MKGKSSGTEKFNKTNFIHYCDLLAERDSDLAAVIHGHGYPPMWTRPASFQTMVHIILEQQVSLASARAALNKLIAKLGKLTPGNVLKLSDSEMKSCYVSRQKTVYIRDLAKAVQSKQLTLHALHHHAPDHVREKLTSIKGIGNWSADIFMMMALRHLDIFPVGDLALIQSFRKLKKIPPETTREEIKEMAAIWKPYSTIASMILWHSYLESGKNRK